MSKVDFRGHPLFRAGGFSAPTRFEADIADCEVEGTIPNDLKGTFYRMACDFEYRPPENEWLTGFNGDGHVTAITFKGDGRAVFKSRYVITPRLAVERKARRRLFGVYRNPYTDDPSVKGMNRTAANTHIYWHGGKMFVLKEDSHAFTIDPYTLAAEGSWDFYGKYKATSMSAHPKVDPVSGEMVAYGYQAKGDLSDDIAVYTVDRNGHITREWWLKAPYVGMVHDIAITQKHIIIPVVGNVTSLARLKSGEPMWEWDATKPTMVGILPRDGDAKDVRWFKGPNRSTLHFLNGVTRGDKVTMELPVSQDQRSPSQIRRWTFDLGSRDEAFGEDPQVIGLGLLPRMDDRFLSTPYQFGYVGGRVGTGPAARAVYQKFDVRKGVTNTYTAAPEIGGFQECSFAPRKDHAPEGDGYIIGVAANNQTRESEVHIADANHLEAGPVAVIKLPFRLRGGTHTNWVPHSQLPV